jgi:hypothetical protein
VYRPGGGSQAQELINVGEGLMQSTLRQIQCGSVNQKRIWRLMRRIMFMAIYQ